MTDIRTRVSELKSGSNVQNLQEQISGIKTQLQGLGPMRPGSLSRRYNVCGQAGCRCKDPQNPRRHGPYYQLQYTHAGKKLTEFVRDQDVKAVQAQLANYKKFRRLVEGWVDLAIQAAKLETKGEARGS
jgi:hypothetical protein